MKVYNNEILRTIILLVS